MKGQETAVMRREGGGMSCSRKLPGASRGVALGMRRYAPCGSHRRAVHLPDLRQRQYPVRMREPGRGDGLSIDPVRGIGVALYLVRPNHRRGDRRSAGGVRALLGISRRSRGAGRERRRLRRGTRCCRQQSSARRTTPTRSIDHVQVFAPVRLRARTWQVVAFEKERVDLGG